MSTLPFGCRDRTTEGMTDLKPGVGEGEGVSETSEAGGVEYDGAGESVGDAAGDGSEGGGRVQRVTRVVQSREEGLANAVLARRMDESSQHVRHHSDGRPIGVAASRDGGVVGFTTHRQGAVEALPEGADVVVRDTHGDGATAEARGAAHLWSGIRAKP